MDWCVGLCHVHALKHIRLSSVFEIENLQHAGSSSACSMVKRLDGFKNSTTNSSLFKGLNLSAFTTDSLLLLSSQTRCLDVIDVVLVAGDSSLSRVISDHGGIALWMVFVYPLPSTTSLGLGSQPREASSVFHSLTKESILRHKLPIARNCCGREGTQAQNKKPKAQLDSVSPSCFSSHSWDCLCCSCSPIRQLQHISQFLEMHQESVLSGVSVTLLLVDRRLMAHSTSLISLGFSFGQLPRTKVSISRRVVTRSLTGLRIRAVQENGGPRRLVDIIRLVPEFSRNYFRSPSRRTLFGGISLLGGFYVAQTISLSFGALGVNDVIAAVLCVLLTEYVTKFYYSRPKVTFPVALLNNFKMGFTYGLFIDAFKLAS
ncbi:hypothetical protein VNO78_27805 [Psophocarpus tetragonolobus]|uniref:Ycf20-like protein n=1 Tax=Psophocarpus tetragonolobus TaxID=3891 RepID=A0AAN9XAZ2_PSOTE